jgi:hypothetical protein
MTGRARQDEYADAMPPSRCRPTVCRPQRRLLWKDGTTKTLRHNGPVLR